MDTLLQDLRYGLRMLARAPGLTLVAVLTLAIGIGGTTSIFSFVNAVVMRPLAYPESHRLAVVSSGLLDDNPNQVSSVTPGDFLDWQEQNSSFERMAAFTGATFSLTGSGEPERLSGATVTTRFFETLRISPLLGRTFVDDDRADADRMAVVSERLWRRRFASDPAVLGKPIVLDGKVFTIAAVMAADFTFPLDIFPSPGARAWRPPDVWTLLTPEPGYRNNAMLQVVARLKPGVTFDQAHADLTAVAARIGSQLPADRRFGAHVQSLHERIVREVRPLLLVFLGAVGFVLVIACVNVANLLLARAAVRQKEVAVRAALGSGRSRLIRQFMTESVLLGLLGGIGGLFVAMWGVDIAMAFVPPGSLPRLQETGFDPEALAFTIVVAVASGMLFGLAPALHSSGTNIVGSLKGSTIETPRLRILDLLVVSEVALAFVLLVGAGLLVRSFLRLASVDPGFRPEHTLTLSVTLPEGAYDTSARMSGFAGAVVERLSTTPGVVHAGAVNWLPLGGSLLSGNFIVEGYPEETPGLWASKPAVTPEYFRAMGIPLLRGRAFSERDIADAPGVAIVTAQLARRVWAGQNAIGKRVKLGFGRADEQPWLTVVGVVGEVRQLELGQDPQPALYVPIPQAPRPFLLRSQTFVVRTDGDPLSVAAAVRSGIRQVDPNLPIDRIETMQKLVATSVSEPRFRSAVLTAFAGAALGLVATGILGVLAYAVTRRTREIGVRMALGAQRADVLRLVVRHALTMTIAGVVVGLIAAIALTRVLVRFLYEVRPTDPVALVGAALVLIAIALVAIYIPARRAIHVDPLTALRAE